MTPDYLNELADIADPDQLWRLNPLDQMELEPVQRRRLDTGVALRRYADHVRQLQELLGTGRSLVMTPLSKNGKAVMTIPAPDGHAKLLRMRAQQPTNGAALSDHAQKEGE